MIRFANRRMSRIQRIESQNQRHLEVANRANRSGGSQPQEKRQSGLCKWLLGASVAVLAALAPQTAFSQTTYTWNNTGVYWHNAANWSPGGGPPGAFDIAEFSIAAPGVVGWGNDTGNRAVDQLRFIAGDYTINNFGDSQYELKVGATHQSSMEISGPATVFTMRGLHLNAFNNGGVIVSDGAKLNLDGLNPNGTRLSAQSLQVDGTVNITNGAEATTISGVVGLYSSGNSVVAVNGVGSRWTNTGNLVIGQNGSGSLLIQDGGEVANANGSIGSAAGSSGSVTVQGLGSRWVNSGDLAIGSGATASLTINAGGQVTNTNGLLLRGEVAVSGIGSRWDNSGVLSIGYVGLGNSLLVENGAEVTSGTTIIGTLSQGGANVTGVGSKWTTSALTVGAGGTGTLAVQNGGGVFSSHGTISGYVHSTSGNHGIVAIEGTGSHWMISGDLIVGNSGHGFMDVKAGGEVASVDGTVGSSGMSGAGNGAVTVQDVGSKWSNSGLLTIGGAGNGALNLLMGGEASSVNGVIGANASVSGTALVTGLGSNWLNSGLLTIGISGNGSLNIESGGSVNSGSGMIGSASTSNGTVTLNGVGSRWIVANDLNVGGQGVGVLNVLGGGEVSSAFGSIGVGLTGSGTVTVAGGGSRWLNSGMLHIGGSTDGTLNIQAGGRVESGNSIIGSGSYSNGEVVVTGAGSRWTNTGSLMVGVNGSGMLAVEAGGEVSSQNSNIGFGGIGTVTIAGVGSNWINSGSLTVGKFGTGTLRIQDGGEISSSTLTVGGPGSGSLNVQSGGKVFSNVGMVGLDASSAGTATVTNAGSIWLNSTNLTVGGEGTGTLNINNSGLVSVGGNTTINASGTVNVNGGRFEFGTTNLTSFSRISATSGSLAGNLLNTGVTAALSLTGLSNNAVDTLEVNLVNSGRLHGNGELNAQVTNTATGELRTLANQSLYFGGTNNSNAGEINNFGGLIEFEGSMTNVAGGMIAGRGVFAANGGWTNNGVMAFSGGFADVLGDVQNGSNGVLVVAGGSTTTFYDDVEMAVGNMNISVSQNSSAVFLGSYNGGSTGLGSVHIMGDLRPGHSPAAVSFGGDLILDNTAFTEIELGGSGGGEFDQLFVGGDLQLGGLLDVKLINGFSLSYNQTFEIGVVDGHLFGEFSNFNDGDLIGNFNGIDLFIDYRSGGMSGNGVSFFTAVPEPTSGLLVGLWGLGLVMRRRVRTKSFIFTCSSTK
ncbi:MAG: hypothetical protein JNL67_19190 [Planctomycetaceae bacterium]|nr:hypothetical protein [Planctomycetaceae bacterium]